MLSPGILRGLTILLWFVNRGVIFYGKGQFEAAISDLTRVIEINPRDARAWNNRGLARQWKGELGAALADSDRAVALAPQLRETKQWLSSRTSVDNNKQRGAIAPIVDSSIVIYRRHSNQKM
jgi:tetratricopeptide (TPR) repeat protein